MTTQITPPFDTANAALAFALYQAGVEFQDASQPVFTVYSEAGLKAKGYTGGTIRQLAQRAFDEHVKGNTRYVFKPDSDVRELAAAYDDQRKALETGTGTGAQVIQSLQTDGLPYREYIVRLTCTMLYMRREFERLWRNYDPYVKIEHGGGKRVEKMPDGGTKEHLPGFDLVPLHATAEHLKKMGLK